MNSSSLIAIVLGIISVVITLKYVTNYEKLDKHMNRLHGNLTNSKLSDELIKIQDTLDISDDRLNNLLGKHSKSIIKLLKNDTITKNKKNKSKKSKKDKSSTKESFVNYKYTDHIQRGLSDFKFSGIIKNKNKPKNKDKNKNR